MKALINKIIMKNIILILVLVCFATTQAQTTDTTTNIKDSFIPADTISFYKDYKTIRDARITGLCTGVAGGLLAGYGATRGNANNIFTVLGGICGAVSFICYIVEISEYNKIAQKHKRIKFTGDKVIVTF